MTKLKRECTYKETVMGVIQNSINSVLGTAAVAAGLGKKIGADKEAAKAASLELDLKQKQELLDTEMEDYRTKAAIESNKAELAKIPSKQVLGKDLEGNKVILEPELTPEEVAAKKDLTKKISMLRRQREIYKAHIESLKGGKK